MQKNKLWEKHTANDKEKHCNQGWRWEEKTKMSSVFCKAAREKVSLYYVSGTLTNYNQPLEFITTK